MPRRTEQVGRGAIEANLEQLCGLDVIVKQLEELPGVKVVRGHGAMDIAFVNERGDLIGFNLFGGREVVGVVVEEDDTKLALRLRRMGKKDDMECLTAQGAEVASLTMGELARWVQYYREAAGYYPVLGRSALDQSGLVKYKRAEVKALDDAVKQMIGENGAYLKKAGAIRLQLMPGGERGYLFDDGRGHITPVVLRNVRRPETLGATLKETVHAELEVAGVVFPKPGERKLDLYVRARNIADRISQELGRRVIFAAATEGQVKLWDGWGMQPEMKQSGVVSEDDLLRLLIFGNSNLDPGYLRRSDSIGDGQWALLNRTLMPGVITFVGRMGHDGRDVRQLPPVQVFDPRARRKGEFKTVALNGAVGIMLVSEDMEFEEMKRLAKPIEDRFSHLMNTTGKGIKPRIIFLTPSLMGHWQKGGFWATEAQVDWIESARRREYGFSLSAAATDQRKRGLYYSSSYTGPKIGGGFRTLIHRGEQGDSLVLLDSGRQFGKEARPERVRYEDMMVTALRNGDLAMWAHVLEPEALLHSTKIISQLMEHSGAAKDPLCAFVASELVANLPEDRIREVLGDKVGAVVMQLGGESLGLFGDPNAKATQVLSHVHIDHTSLTQTVRADIPLLMTLASLVMAEARDDLNPVHAEILSAPKWWMGKPGKATPREDRNVVVMKDGEIYTFDGVKIELNSVEHSTIGAVGRRMEFPGIVVADPGDFRWWGRTKDAGSMTERTVKEWASGQLDWLIMEATGIRQGVDVSAHRWKERLAKMPVITDEDITTGVAEILSASEHAGQTVVVFTSPYDLERNAAIMEAVVVSGRESVLGVRHAMMASRYATEQRLNEASRHQGLDLEFPKYGVFVTEGSKKRTAVTALTAELSSRGVNVYDRYNILGGNGGRVLFFNPFGNEISALDNLPLERNLQVIWSTSIMYSQYDLKQFLNNKASIFTRYTNSMWAEPNFWGGRLPFVLKHPRRGVLHRSGHATPLDMLRFLSFFENKEMGILLHHTERPEEAKRFIQSAFPKTKWKIVTGLPHVDLKSVPSKDKRWAGPLLRLD